MRTTLLIVFLSLLGVAGDALIKLSGQGDKAIELKWFWLGFLVYMLTVPGWFVAMKLVNLSSLGAIYAVSTVLLLVCADVLFFNAKLTGREALGIGLAIAAVVTLRRFV
jgi:undecaprenyl phosphate-alpha-L-ara4N flippase subunit ArnF